VNDARYGTPGLLRPPNRWDFIVLPGLLGLLFLIAWGSHQMTQPYTLGQTLPISLAPSHLPDYALRTTLRMALALACSFLFTFSYATLAAKSRRAERVLIPLLDVLQSVPILGFLSITVAGFLRLFHGSLLGPEAAAVFAIFTSQAWNMAFSFYYSLKMLPKDLVQAADLFGLSPWKRFWKLEVPYAMPSLIWNTMMSVSGGWFFVVASEAITVSHHQVLLPGIGSYIALAIQQRDLTGIGWAILAMLVVILLYDQFAFRPLVAWADKFKVELSQAAEPPSSWFLDLLQRTRLLASVLAYLGGVRERLRGVRLLPRPPHRRRRERHKHPRLRQRGGRWRVYTGLGLLAVTAVGSVLLFTHFVLSEASYGEIGWVFVLGFFTLVRVVVLIFLASLVWVPVGIWIGLRPRVAQRVQPIALVLSAFPANLLFPLAVVVILRFDLNPEIWLSPLMVLGTQWYILFNVIAGASSLSNDLRQAASNLGLRGRLLWKRVLLPAVFPAYLTGGLTASGGAWNASIVAEIVSWGHTTLTATGLGAYIAEETAKGDQRRVVLGIAVMSLYVILFNRLVWKRLYLFAQERMAAE